MPCENTVQSFMELVESGDYVGAIERYYHADASMQENDDAPRKGRDALVEGERQVMASMRSITARRKGEPLISGNHVAIHWQFKFAAKEGSGFTLDEIALQRWHGNEIVEEKFIYDPKQMLG